MSWIAWVVLGGIAGWLASMFMKTDKSMGLVANIMVGVIGAMIGGFIVTVFGAQAGVTGFNLWSLFVAVLGSIVLLWLVKMLRK